MARTAWVFGFCLVALGVGLWLGTGRQSITALIPAFFGVAFVLCGLWARSPKGRKPAMHVAAVLALAGMGGTAKGLLGAFAHLGGTPADRPAAVFGQAAMFVMCLVFFALCVRSFVRARKAA